MMKHPWWFRRPRNQNRPDMPPSMPPPPPPPPDHHCCGGESRRTRRRQTVGHYRKKPVVIEAALVDYDKKHRIPDEFRAQLCTCDALPNEWPTEMHVHTLEGPIPVRDADILIKGVKGEFYPCKPDIFALTYEPVEP